ncbi:MAG: exopolyphosphatase, partial [Pseudomonadota bacterium]
HPDYRAEISFDTAARANLAGLSHSDRIFLGLALMHRYAMRLSSPEYQAVSRFLPDRDNAMAQALGKSMRLGALFSSAGAAGLGGVELTKTESELVLTLSKGAEGFDGERVEQRHASLASDFGLQPVIHS